VKTFSGIDSSLIGLKFDGIFVSPFLWINIVVAFFQTSGTEPDSHISCIISVRKVRRKGQA